MTDGPPPPGQPDQPEWGQSPPPPPGWAPQPPPPSSWSQPPPQYYGPYAQPPKTDGTAVAVLVLAIGSWLAIFFCPFVLAIIALCLAPSAKRNIAQSGGTLTGESLVKAGVVVAWVNIAVVALGIVLFIILVAIGSSTDSAALGLLSPALA